MELRLKAGVFSLSIQMLLSTARRQLRAGGYLLLSASGASEVLVRCTFFSASPLQALLSTLLPSSLLFLRSFATQLQEWGLHVRQGLNPAYQQLYEADMHITGEYRCSAPPHQFLPTGS